MGDVLQQSRGRNKHSLAGNRQFVDHLRASERRGGHDCASDDIRRWEGTPERGRRQDWTKREKIKGGLEVAETHGEG